MWREKLECIDAVEHRVDLNNIVARFIRHPIGQVAWFENSQKTGRQKQLNVYLIEPTTFEWASAVLFVPKNNGSFRVSNGCLYLNKVTFNDIYL